MKVVFLDIDGVLNTEVYMRHLFYIHENVGVKEYKAIKASHLYRDEFGHWFDPMAVDMLKWVIEATGAKIVISSTWRMSGTEVMKELWKKRELPGEIIGITPNHRRRTGSSLQRGKEIQEWLDLHPEVTDYVIIDDDADMEPNQKDSFVQTDYQYGLTYQKAFECVSILNSEVLVEKNPPILT
ncbi:HAD domain-containing protein [Rufibacter quisquiliarum]|uniref:Nucleotidase n=1 Tax=Rufibacter quisquiliarum TaxID=1549639 RepID=A0A839GV51_9BACT|nr:HAD domain-containing protein [Rufibacter quisquiliarum]MBA9078308.1 hypothetical protein [Rufibacter quisquiliarum]